MNGRELIPTYVDTSSGRMHVVTRDAVRDGLPWLVLLHQTPRCWDEFREASDYFEGHRVLMPDLPGYGASEAVSGNTIEAAAAAVGTLLDTLGIRRAHLVGHHYGGLVAYELAATRPETIESLVLSSTPFIDAEERERRRDADAFNHIPPRHDGAHLSQLWRRRTEYLAHPNPAVQGRYVRDVLAHPDPDRGHAAVAAYRSEDRVGRYQGPVLCIASARDPRAYPRRGHILAAFPQARERVLVDGDISSPETCPEEFAEAVLTFHGALAAR